MSGNGKGKGSFSGYASFVANPRLQRVASGYIDHEIVTVRKMAFDGASAEEIGASLGWSGQKATKFIKANKIVWNHRRGANALGAAYRAPDGWQDKAEELRRAGMSLTSIADAVGVSQPTVGRHLREANVPDPKLRRGPKTPARAPKPLSDRQRQRLCDAAIRLSAPSRSETV